MKDIIRVFNATIANTKLKPETRERLSHEFAFGLANLYGVTNLVACEFTPQVELLYQFIDMATKPHSAYVNSHQSKDMEDVTELMLKLTSVRSQVYKSARAYYASGCKDFKLIPSRSQSSYESTLLHFWSRLETRARREIKAISDYTVDMEGRRLLMEPARSTALTAKSASGLLGCASGVTALAKNANMTVGEFLTKPAQLAYLYPVLKLYDVPVLEDMFEQNVVMLVGADADILSFRKSVIADLAQFLNLSY